MELYFLMLWFNSESEGADMKALESCASNIRKIKKNIFIQYWKFLTWMKMDSIEEKKNAGCNLYFQRMK
jgi:hypothetical protein